MSLSKGLAKEYFGFENTYKAEYGDKTCVLMAIGSFYDILEYPLQTPNEDTESRLERIANLLNVTVGGKGKTTDLPYFVGFPRVALGKYLPLLINNGFTVVIVDETKVGGVVSRKVTGVYSSSIYPLHITDNGADGSLMGVAIEMYETGTLYSICNLNTSTNEFHVYEKSGGDINDILDEMLRIMVRYPVNEMIVNVYDETIGKKGKKLTEEYICDYLDIFGKSVIVKYVCGNEEGGTSESLKVYRTYQNITYQKEYLRKVYSEHVDFGLLDPIVYLDMERCQLSVLNCIFVLEFVSRHDIKYITNICLPKMIDEYDYLVLEMNTVQQLNILPTKDNSNRYGSLLQVVNKTSTAVGKRGLRELLCKPFRSPKEIQKRHQMTEELEQLIKKGNVSVQTQLDKICDFERLHRKMSLGLLHPYEFHTLHNTYQTILDLNESVKDTCLRLDNTTIDALQTYIEEYTKIFDVEAMRNFSLNESSQSIRNFFVKGAVKELDVIQLRIDGIETRVETIRKEYEDKIRPTGATSGSADWVKTTYTDQDGYFFTITKIRTKLLQDKLSKEERDDLCVKNQTTSCKLTNSVLKKLSMDLVNNRELFLNKIKLAYLDVTSELVKKYAFTFDILKTFVRDIDITKSNIRCKDMYKYCKPTIVESAESFVRAKEMRHPIIERINDTAYIPNDVTLDGDTKGMVLYALNACGKSSLLRSIGLCVVLAQCGLYVPCTSFNIAPFHNIVTQVDLYDNLWKAQSSFVSEMIGLKKIMTLANENCLVLSDELTKGTEVVSATAIFASSVLNLIKKKCKFVFTTHLQDINKLEEITSCQDLRICHLSVRIESDGAIVFERKLTPGPCSELYGLEVAKAVGLEPALMDLSFDIRNKLLNKKATSLLGGKRSRYNSKKILQRCEVCDYSPTKDTDIPLDTHHINFQCNADDDGFNGHFHKNSTFNLVCLCKRCHVKVHSGEISILGYMDTSKGKRLSVQMK